MSTDLLRLTESLAGRYEVERELGRGGMATVYLARDLKHDRRVALKVLDPDLGAVLGGDRFLSEIRVTANLQHPHLLPLFDSGDASGLLYYVMPYVEGESLRARLDREAPLPIGEAIGLTIAILSALDYAHTHGVVHRDLKPENVLLQHGEPVVADFGIALAVSKAGGQRITQTGISLGTPQYMSPEQATGDRMIDARSDLYSVGAMLYEMLAGEPPHTGATAQAIIARVITEHPRSLRAARDTVPEAIDDAVLKALAKLPVDRWASAHEFADALRGPSITSVQRQAMPWAIARVARRSLASTTLLRALALVLVAAVAVLGWRGLHPPETPMELQLARQLTFEGNVVGTAISADGAWLAYVSDDCFGKEFACSYTLKVREVDGAQSVKLVTWQTIGGTVRWSPDGTTVAFVGAADSSSALSLFVMPRLGGTPQRIGPAPTAWTFAADGRLLAATGTGERESLVWIDTRTFAHADSAPLPAGYTFRDLDVRRDGTRIAAQAVRSGLMLLLLDGRGRLLDSTSAYASSIRASIRWEPNGSGILVTTAAPGVADNVRRVPVEGTRLRLDRATIALGQVVDGADGLIDVAHSGRVVVVSGPITFDILTRRLDDQRAVWTTLTHRTSFVMGSDFTADGRTLAGTATDNLGDNIYAFPLDSSSAQVITALHGIRFGPIWSPDHRHLAYGTLGADGTADLEVLNDVEGGHERRLVVGADNGAPIGWMGNDAVVFFASRTLTILDTTGQVRRQIAIPDSLTPQFGTTGTIVRFDATRKRVAYWSGVAAGLVVADATTGRVATVLHSNSLLRPAGWGSDGSLFVTTAASDSATRSAASGDHRVLVLARLAPDGTMLTRVAELPSGCWVEGGGVIVGGGGTRAACTVRRYSPDVWLADRGGRSGW